MVVSPRCLERGANPSTPSHHQCEGRPPAFQASRAQRAINSAVASAACLEGGPGPLPHLRSEALQFRPCRTAGGFTYIRWEIAKRDGSRAERDASERIGLFKGDQNATERSRPRYR